MAVVFSDHNLDEVKALCNRLVVIRNGRKIYDGNLDIKSSIIIKVKDSSGIDNSIAKKLIQLQLKSQKEILMTR